MSYPGYGRERAHTEPRGIRLIEFDAAASGDHAAAARQMTSWPQPALRQPVCRGLRHFCAPESNGCWQMIRLRRSTGFRRAMADGGPVFVDPRVPLARALFQLGAWRKRRRSSAGSRQRVRRTRGPATWSPNCWWSAAILQLRWTGRRPGSSCAWARPAGRPVAAARSDLRAAAAAEPPVPDPQRSRAWARTNTTAARRGLTRFGRRRRADGRSRIRRPRHADRQRVGRLVQVHLDCVAVGDLAGEQRAGELVADRGLDEPA